MMKINCQLVVDHSLFQQPETHHLVIRVDVPESAIKPKRPVAFCIVLDKSGSMSGTPLYHAKRACDLVFRHVGQEDYLSMVTFNGGSQLVIPMQKAENTLELRRVLPPIKADGNTNLSAGWMLGREELAKAPSDLPRRILLLTDGQTNEGIVDPLLLGKAVMAGCEHHRIRTSCLGFGDEYNESLLRDLAKVSGGQLYDAVSPEKFPAIFKQELDGLKDTVVQNLRIRVKSGDFIDQLIQLSDCHETRLADGSQELSVGDLVYGEERALVLEMNVLPLPKVGNVPVASLEGEILVELEVLWEEIQEEGVVSCRHQQVIRLQRTQNPAEIKVNQETMFWVATQKAGQVMDAATKAMDQSLFSEAQQLVQNAIIHLKSFGLTEQTHEAVALLENLLILLKDTKEFQSKSRKSASYASSAYRNSSSKREWTSRDSLLQEAKYRKIQLEERMRRKTQNPSSSSGSLPPQP